MNEELNLTPVVDAGNLKIYYAIPRDENYKDKLGSNVMIKIEGEINLYSAQHIKEVLEEKFHENIRQMFLELSSVSYIDSSGLGVFLGIHSKIYKLGGGVHLVAPSEKVNYVLVLTKLVGLMKVFPNWKLALDTIDSSGAN